MNQTLEAELSAIRAQNLHRQLRRVDSFQGPVVRLNGRRIRNFSSNDYLGLASNLSLKRTASAAIRKFGTGSGASRLISGNLSPCSELETILARFKRAPAALVFNSGYAAALGTIPSLVGPDDVLIIDKLCHACIIDACRQSGAQLRIYPHQNLKKLASLLAGASARRKPGTNLLVITETVFSMDGDLAPLDEIVALKQKYGAWLMIDEAHATGVYGAGGRGAAEHFGVEDRIEITMGTLGKALGSVGGYVTGSSALIEFLINRARTLIFSTALPPSAYAVSAEAIRQVQNRPSLRTRLWKNIARFCSSTGRPVVSPIIPIEIGDEQRAVDASQRLWEAGYLVPAIRYPTVARGKARLRISLSAAHHREQIEGLVETLDRLIQP